MPKKIDPLNKKMYGAVTVVLTVADVKAAVSFYQKAFGFTKRGIMNGPDGKPMHAELIVPSKYSASRRIKDLAGVLVTLLLALSNVLGNNGSGFRTLRPSLHRRDLMTKGPLTRPLVFLTGLCGPERGLIQ